MSPATIARKARRCPFQAHLGELIEAERVGDGDRPGVTSTINTANVLTYANDHENRRRAWMDPIMTSVSAQPTPAADQHRSRTAPLVVIGVLVVATLVARRLGYKVGGNVVVRCRMGHLFTTIWIPGIKLKAVDLGVARLQRCPVGNHWSLVTPVRDSTLTPRERRFAREHHDVRIP